MADCGSGFTACATADTPDHAAAVECGPTGGPLTFSSSSSACAEDTADADLDVMGVAATAAVAGDSKIVA